MHTIKKSLLCLAMMATITGCAIQTGREFDTAYSSTIERGTTTKADILSNLGEPFSKTMTSDGELWTYQHSQGGNMFQTYKGMVTGRFKHETEALQIVFDGDTVKDFSFTQSK